PKELPLYDYAPDVRVMGDWVYFCASRREENCDRYRTKDILNGPYEKLEGSFPFWDPNLFIDDDGRVYFYWGCSNITPIWGVELDSKTMQPIGEKQVLVEGHPFEIGYERVGEDNSQFPASEAEIDAAYAAFHKRQGMSEDQVPEHLKPLIRGMFSKKPYIEGAWMDKQNGKYYLQYACPGTQYNTYSDGVYESDSPLGPFTLSDNNPYSYKPGGFLPGAGHGSTMRDAKGAWWHTATMRISRNHDFERRVGIWPAGFDADGELFCNQRYGDWPMTVEGDPWRDPAWMLLSIGKRATASSFVDGHEPEKATEENVQSWWRAASANRTEWLQIDLGREFDVHAIQINFADDKIDILCPGQVVGGSQARYIEERDLTTQWKLTGSVDGKDWFVIEDKSDAQTDLSHDLILREEGFRVRFLRLSDMAVPYGQQPCVSGLRVFGLGQGEKPAAPVFTVRRDNNLDMTVSIQPQENTLGYNILFGNSPEKLYHNYMVFKTGDQRIGALIKGRDYFVRVDAFNENGIREGLCVPLEKEE
ncbi:MAG: family 43 glycosylhydrolase, partial [Clostridiales bacterium]|nr:family 43 glycosylhydrolase [Clostridiales bacterium]